MLSCMLHGLLKFLVPVRFGRLSCHIYHKGSTVRHAYLKVLTRRQQLGHKAKKKEDEPRGRGKAAAAEKKRRGATASGSNGGKVVREEGKENKGKITKTLKREKTAILEEPPKEESEKSEKKKNVSEIPSKRVRSKQKPPASSQDFKAPDQSPDLEPCVGSHSGHGLKVSEVEQNLGKKQSRKHKTPDEGDVAHSSSKKANGSLSTKRGKKQFKANDYFMEPDIHTPSVRKKVTDISMFVEYFEFDIESLELDDLKYYLRNYMQQSFSHPSVSLNVYWTRSTCGVRIRDSKGAWKDSFFFSHGKSAGSSSLKVFLSVAAASHFVAGCNFSICHIYPIEVLK